MVAALGRLSRRSAVDQEAALACQLQLCDGGRLTLLCQRLPCAGAKCLVQQMHSACTVQFHLQKAALAIL